MLNKICQVCGNSMYSSSYCGTEGDGTANADFCSNCYRGGEFYSRQWEYNLLDNTSVPWVLFHRNM